MYLQFSTQHEYKNNTNSLEAGQSSSQGYFHVWSQECELDEAFFKCENDWFPL